MTTTVTIEDSKVAADAVSKVMKIIGGLSVAQQSLTINSLKVFLENATPSAPKQLTQGDSAE